MHLAHQLLLQHGRQLTHNIIQASVFQLPTHVLPRVAEFIANLVYVMKQVNVGL